MLNPIKKSKGKNYFKICPKCGSIDVQTDFSNPAVWAYGTQSNYKCNSCGFLSGVFPEIPQNEIESYIKELKQELKEGKIENKKQNLVDTSTGFTIGVFEGFLFVMGAIITFLLIVLRLDDYIFPLIILIIIVLYSIWFFIKKVVPKWH